ncbi:MAG: ABC transporter permease [Thermoplasmata archaeon]
MPATKSGLPVIYHYYLRNYYRSRSFYLIFALMLLVSALMVYLSIRYLPRIQDIMPVRGGLPPGEKERVLLYIWAYVLSDIPVFAAVFFSSPAISGEIENKTAFHIFTLPVDRSILLIGKYLAAVSASLIAMLPYLAAEVSTILYLFSFIIAGPFLVSVGMVVMFIASISAFSFLISSLFNRNLYAYITTFIIYFVIFSSVGLVLQLLYNYNPFFLLNNAASIIERVFINISPGALTTQFSLNAAGSSDILRSFVVMLLYNTLSLVFSLVAFERKEVR